MRAEGKGAKKVQWVLSSAATDTYIHAHTYTCTAPYLFLKCNFPLGSRTVCVGCVHGYCPHGTVQLMSSGNAQGAPSISDPNSDRRWMPPQSLTWLNNILWPECSIDLQVQVSPSPLFSSSLHTTAWGAQSWRASPPLADLESCLIPGPSPSPGRIPIPPCHVLLDPGKKLSHLGCPPCPHLDTELPTSPDSFVYL